MPDTTPEWAAKAAEEVTDLFYSGFQMWLDRMGVEVEFLPTQDNIKERESTVAAIITRCAEDEIEKVAQGFIFALNESVKLQSHYADILNMHDGGRRILFKTADEWMRRLAEARNRL